MRAVVLIAILATGCFSKPGFGGSADDGGTDGAGPDGIPAGAPMPRLLANAYFADNGSTMDTTQFGFSIPTGNLHDGELVLFIANVDNGNPDFWPHVIYPGFQELVQRHYGIDGQTYVVQWKMAAGEPAAYTGAYNFAGMGGSGVATISLIAVSHASSARPVFLETHQVNPPTNPALAESPGVMTIAPSSLVLFAAGCDWRTSPGVSTSSIVPSGYTELTNLGDQGIVDGLGNVYWEWTSQHIVYKFQADAGPTGAITDTLTATDTPPAPQMPHDCLTWNATIAIAPAP